MHPAQCRLQKRQAASLDNHISGSTKRTPCKCAEADIAVPAACLSTLQVHTTTVKLKFHGHYTTFQPMRLTLAVELGMHDKYFLSKWSFLRPVLGLFVALTLQLSKEIHTLHKILLVLHLSLVCLQYSRQSRDSRVTTCISACCIEIVLLL